MKHLGHQTVTFEITIVFIFVDIQYICRIHELLTGIKRWYFDFIVCSLSARGGFFLYFTNISMPNSFKIFTTWVYFRAFNFLRPDVQSMLKGQSHKNFHSKFPPIEPSNDFNFVQIFAKIVKVYSKPKHKVNRFAKC